jgi:hypothetical protein
MGVFQDRADSLATETFPRPRATGSVSLREPTVTMKEEAGAPTSVVVSSAVSETQLEQRKPSLMLKVPLARRAVQVTLKTTRLEPSIAETIVPMAVMLAKRPAAVVTEGVTQGPPKMGTSSKSRAVKEVPVPIRSEATAFALALKQTEVTRGAMGSEMFSVMLRETFAA